MITVVVALPLLGFLIAGLFGKQIGVRPSEIVTTAFLIISAVLSWILFFQYALGGQPFTVSVLGSWFDAGVLKVDWALLSPPSCLSW
jgi:NADH-quinone oxidoreductase subunit L